MLPNGRITNRYALGLAVSSSVVQSYAIEETMVQPTLSLGETRTISEYPMDVCHVPGKDLAVADELSRIRHSRFWLS